MARKKLPETAKKPRADAVHNRERILAAAVEAFKTSGINASLDGIARQAGIGPGTLYRHFPSREDLLIAVFKTEAENLASAAQDYAQTLPPLSALRAWLLLFIDHIETKRVIGPALSALAESTRQSVEPTVLQIWAAVRFLAGRAVESGEMRDDLDAVDLLRAIMGVANVATSLTWKQSATRLIDILILGSRPAAG